MKNGKLTEKERWELVGKILIAAGAIICKFVSSLKEEGAEGGK